MYITASKLYDHIKCPHRVWRDVYGPEEEKIKETNPFVQLLWERGVLHENKIIEKIGEFTDMSGGSLDERFKKTVQAMNNGASLIYQGVLRHENLLGIPDLLKKLPDESYIPVDIKSGAAYEGEGNEDEGKPKKHYAVQLSLYVEILKHLGFRNTNKGIIIDVHGNEVEYNLDEPMGKINKMSWWEFYNETKNNVQSLLNNETRNKPAIAGDCKLCPWHNSCKQWCEKNQDLSRIFYLGRSKRDTINKDLQIEKIDDFVILDIEETMRIKNENKDFLKGIGEKTLNKLVGRANILHKSNSPVIHKKIDFPQVSYELFFDIEDDPMREFVYLHGIYERKGKEERFIDFTARDNTKEAEKETWKKFWDYIRSLPKDDFAVYYYSPHEKTTYKKMQKQYPDVISEDEVEEFFNNPNVIDLYQIIFKHTDWPLSSYSLKEIAMYLGFKWNDETPSGALSIEWYNKYLQTKDEEILNRILIYNQDDCKATMVIKDAIEKLSN